MSKLRYVIIEGCCMHNRVILLVEDDYDDATLTLLALAKNHPDHSVVLARDGLEALDYLFGTGSRAGRDPVMPQLILMDLQMPNMGGIEALRQIRSHDRTKYLPVVILTASQAEQDRRHTSEMYANSYICKSINFAEFLDTVRHVSNYWLGLNAPTPLAYSSATGSLVAVS
jgi:two-component system, response regulator